ncbi:hypothetical protein NN3_47510 [Nocardia neocaledoniensis NBRC 108232]|uniref:SHOCT domain-containing protein n=1 Tax=Nocardia neocaledoniensis TaxID=236511 RepID=A0A317N1W2_9NOCA|nr:hypothetical protein [Nocardia neocaledoniensis]PWV67884.1 hypothetical protein DFR69_11857 [Nocardia neocaledoniensis]GEM33744.1 hypothetical protein NN3_47510 [Nocardia neocaledoniensis NBRC 108232]
MVALIFLARRRYAHRGGGIEALRTGFARGEISEAEYRSRLAVLTEPRKKS